MRIRTTVARVGLLGLMFTLLTAACQFPPGGEPTYGDQTQLTESGFVVCSQECADRGQCGTADDGTSVVLAHEANDPIIRGHNTIIPSNTAVVFTDFRAEQVVQSIDGVPFMLNFYRVIDQASLASGWVAGWCVADRAS